MCFFCRDAEQHPLMLKALKWGIFFTLVVLQLGDFWDFWLLTWFFLSLMWGWMWLLVSLPFIAWSDEEESKGNDEIRKT